MQNLTVHAVDAERGLILIKGADPGQQGRPVVLRTAAKEGWRRSTVTTSTSIDATGRAGRHRRAARRAVRRAGQHPADPPGRGGPAGRGPAGYANAKTRGEVSGGGRKPYRQKGTGRARQGSIRAPQYAGGGVVHGPTPARLRPAHAEEDDRRRAAWRAVGPGPRGPGARGREPRRRRQASTKAAATVAGRAHRPPASLVVVDRDDETAWLSLRNVAAVHDRRRRPAERLRRAGQRRGRLHQGGLRGAGRPAGRDRRRPGSLRPGCRRRARRRTARTCRAPRWQRPTRWSWSRPAPRCRSRHSSQRLSTRPATSPVAPRPRTSRVTRRPTK